MGKSLLYEIDEMMRKYLIQFVSQNLDDERKSKGWLNNTLVCYGNYKAYSKKDIDGLNYSRIKHIMILKENEDSFLIEKMGRRRDRIKQPG